VTASLAGCETPPAKTFDAVLLDLDGVVYVGSDAVPHAAEALREARASGVTVTYLTNNASRSAAEVAQMLRRFDVDAAPEQVVSSAHAAARLLADRLPGGAAVLVTGTAALGELVAEAGLRPVDSADDDPAAVVMGYDSTIDYPRLAEACLAIERGALFVASNLDATLPSERGRLPGMGSLAALVTTATGRDPLVAGKPERPLFDDAVGRAGARNPLMVGDRLDTDIEGARRAGLPAMVVLTGVTSLLDLVTAPADRRPTLVAADLRALNEPHPAADAGRSGTAHAEYDDSARAVRLRNRGSAAENLAAVVTAGWQAVDAEQQLVDVDPFD
jgi:HAD superfamily hydrolase (TIGR01457 family)